MNPLAFVAKWKKTTLTERSSEQQHFLDLCDLVGQQSPAEVDPAGEWFTFERGVEKAGGGKGWADVWKRGCFAMEYKGKDKHKDLGSAYKQLLLYREALDNPPLLIVSDIGRNEIHTNFTGTAKKVYSFTLEQIADPDYFAVLRKTFHDPEALKPGRTTKGVTEEVADRFAMLGESIWGRGVPVEAGAQFLMRLMFCMFAEKVNLLPDQVFTKVLTNFGRSPSRLSRRCRSLFATMAKGGAFGPERIPHFNGGLFAEPASIELTPNEIDSLLAINGCEWGDVEPSIFGTLLERTVDPNKRHQIGTHYTGKEDIVAILEPVMMVPLRREWAQVKSRCDELWREIERNISSPVLSSRKPKQSPQRREFDRILLDFIQRLSEVTVLDPACGAGNFLYVSLNLLLELEKEVIAYASSHSTSVLPHVTPSQLAGLEKNPYALELARVVIWIGYLQWKFQNGFSPRRDPVLDPVDKIVLADAVLDQSDPDAPKEMAWPAADYIVGNPPFLGGKRLRAGLGDSYVDQLFRVWAGRVKAEADLCCYWFEKARSEIQVGRCRRAGLLATQGIRGGANSEVLKRIKLSGDIFFGESDRDWILDGANVHVSMVGFDNASDTIRHLDGARVPEIHGDLTAGVDVTKARPLAAAQGVSYMGDTKGGSFDISEAVALQMLGTPNPNGRPNSDVLVPWMNGLDVARRHRRMWIIDFGIGSEESQAALYESPFEYIRQHVRPERQQNKREAYRSRWWLHVEARSGMRRSLAQLPRFIVMPRVAKHLLFSWGVTPTLPDCQLITFAHSGDYPLGLLQSRVHEVWARSLGTQVRERESGFRYTPTTCFETFPFPHATEGQKTIVAEAAASLDQKRTAWLNPQEWTREEILVFPGSADGPWKRYVHGLNASGVGTVRYPRLIPKDEECATKLANRTLTALYNQRPAWLDLAHRELDHAVLAAYDMKPSATNDEILANLLDRNLELVTGPKEGLFAPAPVALPR